MKEHLCLLISPFLALSAKIENQFFFREFASRDFAGQAIEYS
jgi:hypothetical protein